MRGRLDIWIHFISADNVTVTSTESEFTVPCSIPSQFSHLLHPWQMNESPLFQLWQWFPNDEKLENVFKNPYAKDEYDLTI